MITSGILYVIATILGTLISWLPNATTLGSGFNDAWTWISDFIAHLFWVIPGGEQFLVQAGLTAILLGSILIWKLVKFFNQARQI